MTKPVQKEPIVAVAILVLIFWSVLVLFSFYWNYINLHEQKIILATAEARANWNKDLAFRRWATRHGGVYVKPDKRTPPNPYLAQIEKRDVVTTDGMALTLMNPAYMMRQMIKETEGSYGIRGNITGKVLLNPLNAPDDWERLALDKFEQGITEVLEETDINNEPYLRFMKPMIMEQGCVKCHGHLGFKVGDIRGGVSVSIPLKPYLEITNASVHTIALSHGGVWLVGCLGVFIFCWIARVREQGRLRLQHELEESHALLERRVVERTNIIREQEKKLLESQAHAHHANKMASLGEMAGEIAHEINSPLQAIKLITYKVKRDAEKSNDNNILSAMDKLDNSVTNITRTIDSLRKMTRDSSDDEKESVEVESIVQDVINLTEERFKKHNITFPIRYHEHCEKTKIHCQRLQIGRILINLLNNAFDAVINSPDKSIWLDIVDRGESIEIRITDSGHGITEAIHDQIFEPMFTSKDIGKGTGLGLSMSLEIAQNHGGTLVLDKENENTTFILTLPI